MQLAAIREAFLTYFQTHGHTIVSSSSLVPHNDSTLLFTNAGMVQFKDVFLGLDKRAYTRATTAQRCVRAGGKHNDLDNVGYTARHHTFFEMLGNFSFGDYFKKEAIHFAWNFLTNTLKLPREKLWVTVHQSDDEAAAIWINDIKVDPARISRCGDKDNFWAMGDTGPCGPCTEIFYDHGPDIAGGPPGSPEADGDRYIEIWNLVFMQFNRSADGTMTPLPRPSVDTGMGLERIAAIMQGVHNNYDIDLFVALINHVRKVLAVHDDAHVNSLRVIADHIRSSSFLVADGVLPSNEGRGYVLRRIIRRAIRHGHRVGARGPFFSQLVAPLSVLMGEAYPELRRQQTHIEKVLLKEEEQFAITLDQGLKLLEQAIAQLTTNVIPGQVVFKLYDTYGFPVDLTADIARERALHIDQAGFDVEMQKQREQSKAASQFSTQRLLDNTVEIAIESEFHGYDCLTLSATVKGLLNAQGEAVDSLIAGEGSVVLDKTPFYAESGGQVGDIGELSFAGGSFVVMDTRKHQHAIMHLGQLSGASLRVGDTVTATVKTVAREAIALNHSATHLLHASLRQLLGAHVQQKGSLVDAERLRFDFLHPQALSRDECDAIEQLVNREIRANHVVATTLMSPEAAKAAGAMALFGEKYGDEVRVLAMGEFSRELCGGTHAKRTGDIGLFKLVSESGIASGVRRIEAVTGAVALRYVAAQLETLTTVAQLFKATPDSVLEKAQQSLALMKQVEKAHEALQQRMAVVESRALLAKCDSVAGIAILATRVEGATAKTLKDMLDPLKEAIKSGVILLAAVEENTVSLLAGVTQDLTDRVRAGDLVKFVAEQLGGKGGGRADMAQGGGTDVKLLQASLSSVQSWVEARVS